MPTRHLTPSRQQAIVPECVTLVLRSIETSAGIAGKDFGEILRSLARDCDCLFHRRTCAIGCRPNKAPPRKKTRWLLWLEDTSKWTCLAVQQQLIEPDQPC